MRFCCECGGPVARAVPQGDDRPRWVCQRCGAIHYENPKVVVGCLVEKQGALLMCRRGIEPRRGYWTVPAGFLELGEGLQSGALRETEEETGLQAAITAAFAYLDLPDIGQIYALFRALVVNEDNLGPTPESLELQWCRLDAIPWEELAFPVVRIALELYAEDRRRGQNRLHQGLLRRKAQGVRFSAGSHRLEEHRSWSLDAGL